MKCRCQGGREKPAIALLLLLPPQPRGSAKTFGRLRVVYITLNDLLSSNDCLLLPFWRLRQVKLPSAASARKKQKDKCIFFFMKRSG